jgi:hypothetical protein
MVTKLTTLPIEVAMAVTIYTGMFPKVVMMQVALPRWLPLLHPVPFAPMQPLQH